MSIVVPTFNEERRLHGCFLDVRQLASEQEWGDDVEVIVVDDGSRDRTVEVARDQLGRIPRGRLLHLPWHVGKGAAVRLGIATAQGDVIVFMDADVATDLGALRPALDALQDADLVIGSRAIPGAVVTGRSRTREILHRVFRLLVRRLAGVSASDPQCGFKTFRSEAAKMLFSMSRVDGFGFDVEVLLLAQKIGYSIVEIPVRWHSVDGSHVQILRHSLSMLRDVLRLRRRYQGREPLPDRRPPLLVPDRPVVRRNLAREQAR